MKYFNNQIATRGETYELALFERKENSPYEWKEAPSVYFKGRPANNHEKRNYRILKGIGGNQDSVFVVSSNIPADIKPEDKVSFMGKIWTVASVGYYYDNSLIVNASIMNNDYLISRCPKGLSLQ